MNPVSPCPRRIEVVLPIREISAESVRDKSLRQLADRAWLYVVTFCRTGQPRLRIIQDAIPKLNTEALYRQIQFLVEEADWTKHGEEIAKDGGEQ